LIPLTSSSSLNVEYAYFFFYSLVRGSYMKRLSARAKGAAVRLSTVEELVLGAVAGALGQIFTIPVSVIATRQQVGGARRRDSSNDNDAEKKRDNSFLGVAREIVREEGVGGLWLGLRPGLVLTVNPAITYGVFERVKGTVLLARAKAGVADSKLGPWLSFLVGATSKTLATIVRRSSFPMHVKVANR
jgi:solute carrier family 25 (peroxisomal adenine nucleotide transporter), member 17